MTEPPPSLNYQSGREAPTNGLGIAGFVVSLIGLLSCGLISPIGLVLSAFGMRQFPRGLATAGLVMGIVGTLALAAIASLTIYSMYTVSTAMSAFGPEVATYANIQTASVRVQTYYDAHGTALPSDADGVAVIATDLDGWGRPLRYRLKIAGEFEIRSAGLDGIFDNSDDVAEDFDSASFAPPAASSAPAVER